MHYKCDKCGKMIQDYWRMISLVSECGGEELHFCSENCKEEYQESDKKRR